MRLTINESMEDGVYTIHELDNEYVEKVLELAWEGGSLSDTLSQRWSEDMTDYYDVRLEELVNQFNQKHDFEVNQDSIYWSDGSQGPYPEWNLSEVFDTVYDEIDDDTSIEICFDGRKTTDVYRDSYIIITQDGYDEEVYCKGIDESVLAPYELPKETVSNILSKLNDAQKFMDNLWTLISNTCKGIPENDWVIDSLDINNDEFEIVDGEISYLG